MQRISESISNSFQLLKRFLTGKRTKRDEDRLLAGNKTPMMGHSNDNSLPPSCCAICLEEFDGDKDLSKTECGHVFHCSCLKTWTDFQTTCPYCRFKFIDGSNDGDSTSDDEEDIVYNQWLQAYLANRHRHPQLWSSLNSHHVFNPFTLFPSSDEEESISSIEGKSYDEENYII